jgi:Leucine-rich repeat (LRR) protein
MSPLFAWSQNPMDVQIIPLRELYPNKVQFRRQLPPDQRIASEQIEELGGGVMLHHETAKPPAESISFKGDRFTDVQIQLLNPFKNTPLHGLAFVHTRLTDRGIAETLTAFKNLKSLTIFEMPIEDKALVPLADFRELEYVVLSRTRISSAAIRLVRDQPNLYSLDISETEIDDSGVNHLRSHANLKRLSAGKTQLTSRCLPAIGTLARLESLSLYDTKVNDEEFVHIANLHNLRSLQLSRTQITNAAMPHIAKLTALKDLDIEGTAVDETGLALLKNMPHLREVRWMDPERATPGQRRFFAKFILYLPGNMDRWKDIRSRLERGEVTLDQLATPQ